MVLLNMSQLLMIFLERKMPVMVIPMSNLMSNPSLKALVLLAWDR